MSSSKNDKSNEEEKTGSRKRPVELLSDDEDSVFLGTTPIVKRRKSNIDMLEVIDMTLTETNQRVGETSAANPGQASVSSQPTNHSATLSSDNIHPPAASPLLTWLTQNCKIDPNEANQVIHNLLQTYTRMTHMTPNVFQNMVRLNSKFLTNLNLSPDSLSKVCATLIKEYPGIDKFLPVLPLPAEAVEMTEKAGSTCTTTTTKNTTTATSTTDTAAPKSSTVTVRETSLLSHPADALRNITLPAKHNSSLTTTSPPSHTTTTNTTSTTPTSPTITPTTSITTKNNATPIINNNTTPTTPTTTPTIHQIQQFYTNLSTYTDIELRHRHINPLAFQAMLQAQTKLLQVTKTMLSWAEEENPQGV